ncbi:MAG: protein-disulfide reductase DsbD family protein [Hyphomonadaceae bacterium]
MTLHRLLAAAAFALAAFSAPALAQPVRTDNVEAELHSARSAVAPGETFTIALRQNIREHWHTYWLNPGDSGEPTELTWQTPAGWQVGEIQWPTPEALPFAILVNYGYSNEVLIPVTLTAPANARPGETVTLTADAYWLVCSDVCIPEEATLTLAVPIAAQGADDPQWAPRIADAIANLPRPMDGVDARITAASPATLSVSLPNAEAIRNPRFFPFDRDAMEASAAQRPRVGAGGVSFSLTPGVAENLGQVPLEGVLAYEAQENGQWVRRGVEINAQPGDPLPGTADTAAAISADYALAELEGGAAAANQSLQAPPLAPAALFAALAFAFIGGLILNIMPCVLPVLSIKALQFAGGGHDAEARKHGLLYFAGVLISFQACGRADRASAAGVVGQLPSCGGYG